MHRNSDLRRSRSHLEHLSLPVIRKNRNFHSLCESSGLGLTDGCDHALIEACALANITPHTHTDCGNLLIHGIAPGK